MTKIMFEKFTDFNGKQFQNLWGDLSCECFVDSVSTYITFYLGDEEVLCLSGNEGNDILDSVLSKYYINEESTIEDCFSSWLKEYYNNNESAIGDEVKSKATPTNDDIPLSTLYKNLLKYRKRQDRIIEKQKAIIKRLKEKIDKYSIKNHEMRKQLDLYEIANKNVKTPIKPLSH